MSSAARSEDLPNSYPADWNVIMGPKVALPPDYPFGRQTITLSKGTVVPLGAAAAMMGGPKPVAATMPLPCDIVWERDVPITLRDGAVIYTDILRPASQATHLPAIISWSPYGKSIPTPAPQTVPPERVSGLAKSEGADAAFFACNGYAVVNPDARGAYKSQGIAYWWGRVDAGDLHDAIEWVGTQPWSNGKVATYGSSWLAITQWFAAATKPPHLSAIIPWNGFMDLYRDSALWGGMPDLDFANHLRMTGEGQAENMPPMAARDGLMNEYWQDKRARVEDISVPAYVVADGVTSLHPHGAIEGFRRMASKDKWLRINDTNEWFDQYDPKYERDVLKFLDHYLKGADNGWEQTPRVRVSVLDAGGSDKVDVPFSAWPIPQTRYQRLYLNADDGTLSTHAIAKPAAAKYESEKGETTFTITFDQDTQIIGYLKAHLWTEVAGSDDMDLFVLVEKLDPSGHVLVPQADFAAGYFPLVPPPGAPGRLRVSLRELDPALSTDFIPVQRFTTPMKLKVGEVVPVDIAIQPRAYFFHAGQKLRLTVAGFNIRYTTASKPMPTLNHGTHIIHTGGKYSSFLQIPTVPFRR